MNMRDSDARRLDADWRADAIARARCRLERARARRKELADLCRDHAHAIEDMEAGDLAQIQRDLTMLGIQVHTCMLDINDAEAELRSLGVEE